MKRFIFGAGLVIFLLLIAACSPDQYKEVTITLPICSEANASSFHHVGDINATHSAWQMTKLVGMGDSVIVTLKCVGHLVSSEN